MPTKPVIAHIEGGRAGGHHSWEDLDDLLLSTYSGAALAVEHHGLRRWRHRHPERAAEYLSGRWSEAYGYPQMPVDGILVGTAAMACLEATTSPAVKQLLVDTAGTDQWVGPERPRAAWHPGAASSAPTSMRSTTPPPAAAALLDDVAGDAEAVAARRAEIIAAMAPTAKPYFGDVAEMTYLQWLQRYVELAIGDGDSTADTKARARRGWTSPGATGSPRCCSARRPG